MTKKISEKENKKKSLWKERIWNLIMLLVGAAITFFTTYYFNEAQYQKEKKSIIIVIDKEVKQHLKVMKNFNIGMNNIKAGSYPEIGAKDVTLDRALEKGKTEWGGRLGITHNSPVLESILPNLKILPPEIIENVLSFHAALQRCEIEKFECESCLNERLGKVVCNPSPGCEVYLTVIQDAIPVGDSLILRISNYLEDNK